MNKFSSPLDIARETFRLLAQRRTPPTPDNYRTLYLELSGGEGEEERFPEKPLASLVEGLPGETPEQLRLVKDLEQFIRQKDWEGFRGRLLQSLTGLFDSQRLGWGPMINELILRLEARQAAIPNQRKRESLEHVLASAANPELLFNRLQSLLRSWAEAGAEAPTASTAAIGAPAVPSAPATVAAVPAPASPPAIKTAAVAQSAFEEAGEHKALRELVAIALEAVSASQATETPDLSNEAVALAQEIRRAEPNASLQDFLVRLKAFAFRLERAAEDQAELRAGLLSLLRLFVENVSDIVSDDRWLHGQMELVRGIVEQPLSLRTIDEAGLRLHDVIYKQSQLKQGLEGAKDALKSMLAGFVDQLAGLADTTSGYHDRIGHCADKISAATSLDEISDVITEVMQETRVMQHSAAQSRDELLAAQQRVQVSEERILQLEVELQQTSELVRYDQLTGVLNRRGMEEMFVKETARARRRQSSLCVGMLDIDNFKKLNDSLGHKAGDDALVHLTTLCRETLRPQDTVARYGGEEFIILLPETDLEEAVATLTRLQRELTRRIFMHETHKVLITFSAGVTPWREEDTQTTVIKRADEAMYRAKQTGKNRVVTAD